jgi:hypothetical protein
MAHLAGILCPVEPVAVDHRCHFVFFGKVINHNIAIFVIGRPFFLNIDDWANAIAKSATVHKVTAVRIIVFFIFYLPLLFCSYNLYISSFLLS